MAVRLLLGHPAHWVVYTHRHRATGAALHLESLHGAGRLFDDVAPVERIERSVSSRPMFRSPCSAPPPGEPMRRRSNSDDDRFDVDRFEVAQPQPAHPQVADETQAPRPGRLHRCNYWLRNNCLPFLPIFVGAVTCVGTFFSIRNYLFLDSRYTLRAVIILRGDIERRHQQILDAVTALARRFNGTN